MNVVFGWRATLLWKCRIKVIIIIIIIIKWRHKCKTAVSGYCSSCHFSSLSSVIPFVFVGSTDPFIQSRLHCCLHWCLQIWILDNFIHHDVQK